MAMSEETIRTAISKAIPDAKIELRDLAGDGDHWACHVISESFKGLSRVMQHRKVYEAFGEDMGTVLHALAVKTSTP